MTHQYKGAIFFDVDGTLIDGLDGIYQPTERTKEALRRLRQNGYMTILASGRSMLYLPEFDLQFDGYITSNGAHVEVDGQTIADRFIPEENLRELAHYFDVHHMNYMIEGSQGAYCNDMREESFQTLLRIFNLPAHVFHPLTDICCIPVHKLMISYHNLEQRDAFIHEYGDRYQITPQPGNLCSDIGQKNVTKATGVEELIRHFDLNRMDTYAFGDADNDYEMFCAVGNGIAMGRHSAKLETVAKYITQTVREEGIAEALHHLGLIQ